VFDIQQNISAAQELQSKMDQRDYQIRAALIARAEVAHAQN
jgi:hypothetical protein